LLPKVPSSSAHAAKKQGISNNPVRMVENKKRLYEIVFSMTSGKVSDNSKNIRKNLCGYSKLCLL
jgi:hypothetical protein